MSDEPFNLDPMHDEVLGRLVQIAEDADGPISLVLLVQGVVVSGDLVSRSRWNDAFGDESSIEQRAFRWLLEVPTPPSSPLADDGVEGQAEVSGLYAHLVNVTIFNGPHKTHSPVLRLRTEAVNGWMPGRP